MTYGQQAQEVTAAVCRRHERVPHHSKQHLGSGLLTENHNMDMDLSCWICPLPSQTSAQGF